jgi:hypothetical protein
LFQNIPAGKEETPKTLIKVIGLHLRIRNETPEYDANHWIEA